MTRETFIAALRDGLAGLPPDAVEDVVGDYDGHIAEAQRHGRSEAEVIAALGDPARIARELRAEIRVRHWQVKRDPAAALQAIAALVGLGTANLLLLPPLLAIVLPVLVAFALTALGLIGSGGLLMLAALADAPERALGELFAVASADVGGSALLALAFAATGVASLAASLLLGVALVNAAVWYGRLHYRLIRPPPRRTAEPHATKLTVIGS